MITSLFQSIGVVFTLLIIVAVVLVSMYISYLLGIGVIILSLVFITYHILATLKTDT